MNEGLEELKKLGDEYPSEGDTLWAQYSERFSIIEKSLKRLEELEKAFAALSKDDEKTKKLLSKEIEKNRAFEIIKKHELADTLFSYLKVDKTPNEWNWGLPKKMQLIQEEWDLLREALL